jgi:hypothetical protein
MRSGVVDPPRAERPSFWRRLTGILFPDATHALPVDSDDYLGKAAKKTRFVGFDEQRYYGDERRADVVFGPDMFDPRTENGARPLSRAVARGDSDIDPADFEKTVGEVLGPDADLDDLTRVSLRNVESIKIDPADAG